jgi:hypothetical protein
VIRQCDDMAVPQILHEADFPKKLFASILTDRDLGEQNFDRPCRRVRIS